MRDAWALSFGTLTAWPVPPPRSIEFRTAGTAILLAPLTQVPLLALTALGSALWLALGGAPPVLAALLIGAVVLSTRGMHLDGLADTADGLSASYDRERALAVMKAPDVGPSGVAAVVLALLLQAVALAAIIDVGAFALAGVALLVSRQVLAGACHPYFPPLSVSGLGHAVAGTVSTTRAAVSGLIMLGIGVLAAATGQPWWAGPVVVVVGWLAAAVTLLHARRRLGGINGDVLGATIEATFAAALAGAALVA